jgi:hypothetical protein
MLAASILAIFFIPVSFDVVEKFGIWVGGERELRAPLPPPATAEGTGHDD